MIPKGVKNCRIHECQFVCPPCVFVYISVPLGLSVDPVCWYGISGDHLKTGGL